LDCICNRAVEEFRPLENLNLYRGIPLHPDLLAALLVNGYMTLCSPVTVALCEFSQLPMKFALPGKRELKLRSVHGISTGFNVKHIHAHKALVHISVA